MYPGVRIPASTTILRFIKKSAFNWDLLGQEIH
jgi:hypothetical protein